MSNTFVLTLNDPRASLEVVGGKGASLARLIEAGFPVPEGFHVTTEAYRQFVLANDLQPRIDAALQQVDPGIPSTLEAAAENIHEAFMAATIPAGIASAIVAAYGDLAGTDPAVAVRSSATAEDLPQASFAGQQETYLNVSGADHVLKATQKCWASLWTARAIGYRSRQDIHGAGVALAVVVQQLVDAEVAGILFTVNPVDGSQEHAMISGAWGLGDAVVGGRVTPDEYVMEKDSHQLVKREVADKELMTVKVDGDTEDQPVPENLRKVPVLEEHDLVEITRLGVAIEKLYQMPMDIEWTLSDGEVSIVQARPITALPHETKPPEVEWELPDPKGRYLRTSIVDFMPDPLSPLFASMGTGAYNAGLRQMLTEYTGIKGEAFPAELIVTINDYAYFVANYTAGQWWAMLRGLGPRLPKLIREGPDHFRQVALPEYQAKVKVLSEKPLLDMSAEELWRDAHELIGAAVYHLSVLQVDTLGASAGSEGLFTGLYNRFLFRQGDPPASAFLMGYDTIPIRSEKALYDLAKWVEGQNGLKEFLLEAPVSEIVVSSKEQDPPAGVAGEIWAAWRERFDEYRETFGHIVYDFDFVSPVPKEDPTPGLEAVKMYLRGEGADPHERQSRLEGERKHATERLLERARGLRGWAIKKALGWAQSMGEVREDSIASIGLAYPRLRELLMEIGRRLVDAGVLDVPEDVFFLYEAEIEAILKPLEAGGKLESLQYQVDERKTALNTMQKLMPPSQLPYSKSYMGIPLELFVPHEGEQEGGRLKGVGASAGKITGPACVLHGPEDFDQMKQGRILVAKMTTPAWTPLFAMAGAVVTDIGGPLSHGSIVAREYGIPAVLGTGVATHVIATGQEITVDGDAGVVILEAPS